MILQVVDQKTCQKQNILKSFPEIWFWEVSKSGRLAARCLVFVTC